MILPAALMASLVGAPSPILHLRADTGVVLDSKGAVSAWKDLSTRGTDFSSLDSVRRPLATNAGLQGRPSIRFKGAQILADTLSSLPLDSGFTLFFVAQDSNPSGNSAFLNKGRNDVSVDLWGQSAGNFQFSQAWVVTVAKTSFQTSEPMLYESTFDGDSARLFVAGRREAAGAFAGKMIRSKTTWLCGARDGSWQGYFNGHVGEVIVYPGELDDTTRIRIESELLSDWKIGRLGTWERPADPIDSVSTAPILHLRADTGLVLDSKGAVKTWIDLSPRHTDFHALDESGGSDSSLRPVAAPKALAGLPAVTFSGAQILCDTTRLPLDSGFSLFFVAQNRNTDGQTAFLDKAAGDLGVNLWNQDVGNFQVGQSWVVVFAQSSFQTSLPELYEATWIGDTAKLYAHGNLLATGLAKPMNLVRARTTWLGGNYHSADGGLNHFLTGEISEVLVYPGLVSEPLRKKVESDMIDRWNLGKGTVGIPSDSYSRSAKTSISRNSERWILSNAQGKRAMLLDATGRVLASARFIDGEASLPVSGGLGILQIETSSGAEALLVTSTH